MSTPEERSMWNPEQIGVLCETVQHWLENWEVPRLASARGDSCPCCQYVMQANGEPECERCPIGIVTGDEYCEDTPWKEAFQAIARAQSNLGYDRRLIKEEYQFLVEVLLLEKEEA